MLGTFIAGEEISFGEPVTRRGGYLYRARAGDRVLCVSPRWALPLDSVTVTIPDGSPVLTRYAHDPEVVDATIRDDRDDPADPSWECDMGNFTATIVNLTGKIIAEARRRRPDVSREELKIDFALNVAGEAGEAVEALRRYRGNARRSGTIEEYKRELIDVIVSASVCLLVWDTPDGGEFDGASISNAAAGKLREIFTRGWEDKSGPSRGPCKDSALEVPHLAHTWEDATQKPYRCPGHQTSRERYLRPGDPLATATAGGGLSGVSPPRSDPSCTHTTRRGRELFRERLGGKVFGVPIDTPAGRRIFEAYVDGGYDAARTEYVRSQLQEDTGDGPESNGDESSAVPAASAEGDSEPTGGAGSGPHTAPSPETNPDGVFVRTDGGHWHYVGEADAVDFSDVIKDGASLIIAKGSTLTGRMKAEDSIVAGMLSGKFNPAGGDRHA